MRPGCGHDRTPMVGFQRGEPYRADLQHWTVAKCCAGLAEKRCSRWKPLVWLFVRFYNIVQGNALDV